MAKKNLLLVDGDARSQRLLEVSLRKAGFSVTTAVHGNDAMEKVAIAMPDLIISDTKLPEGDGFDFCRRLKSESKTESIPFIFLTAQKAIEHKIKGLELGVDDYLTKPIYMKEVVTRVRILLEKREKESLERRDRSGFSGFLGDMGVVDLLQTIEIGRKTGILHLENPPQSGEVFFRNGKVVDAEVGRLRGDKAVYRFLVWNDGVFSLDFVAHERNDNIELSTQGLLMEGMRRVDEWGRMLEQLPPLDNRFDIDYREFASRLAEIPDEVNSILRLFDGEQTLMEIVDLSDFGDLEALNIISKLYFEGLIHDVTTRNSADDGTAAARVSSWLDEPAREDATPTEDPPTAAAPASSPALEPSLPPAAVTEDQLPVSTLAPASSSPLIDKEAPVALAAEAAERVASWLEEPVASPAAARPEDAATDQEDDWDDVVAPVSESELAAALQSPQAEESGPGKDLDRSLEDALSTQLSIEVGAPPGPQANVLELPEDRSVEIADRDSGGSLEDALAEQLIAQALDDMDGDDDVEPPPSQSSPIELTTPKKTKTEPLFTLPRGGAAGGVPAETQDSPAVAAATPVTQPPFAAPAPSAVLAATSQVEDLPPSRPAVVQESDVVETVVPPTPAAPAVAGGSSRPTNAEESFFGDDQVARESSLAGSRSLSTPSFSRDEMPPLMPAAPPGSDGRGGRGRLGILLVAALGLFLFGGTAGVLIVGGFSFQELRDRLTGSASQPVATVVDAAMAAPDAAPAVVLPPAATDAATPAAAGSDAASVAVATTPDASTPPVDAGTATPTPAVTPRRPDAGHRAAVEPKPAAPQETFEDYIKKGRALADRGKLRPAVAAYRKALEINSRSPEAYTALANAYYELDELSNAERNLKKAVTINDRYAPAYVLLGTVYQSLGRNAEAIQAYDRYLTLAPSGPFAKDVREVVSRLKAR
ncbi:MAG: DUF4388 domain-containing protein [Pseudomonadota bacterium]